MALGSEEGSQTVPKSISTFVPSSVSPSCSEPMCDNYCIKSAPLEAEWLCSSTHTAQWARTFAGLSSLLLSHGTYFSGTNFHGAKRGLRI